MGCTTKPFEPSPAAFVGPPSPAMRGILCCCLRLATILAWPSVVFAQLDCHNLVNPLQVVTSHHHTDYSLRLFNWSTQHYDVISSLPFFSGTTIDAVGIVRTPDGLFYAVGESASRICRFDTQQATCFDIPLLTSRATVGTVVHNNYYYAYAPGTANGTAFYVVTRVDTTAPIVHNDSRFSFNTSLFAGTVLDVAPVENASLVTHDHNAPRSYLVGLGAQSELVIIKLNASDGYPESYAVLPSIFTSKQKLRLGTGVAAFTHETMRIFFASNDGDGIYELETPLHIPPDCWNVGHNVIRHAVCDKTSAFLRWVHDAPPTGNLNDGFSCPGVHLQAWPIFQPAKTTLPPSSRDITSSIAALHFNEPSASFLRPHETHYTPLVFASSSLPSRHEAAMFNSASRHDTSSLPTNYARKDTTTSVNNVTFNLTLDYATNYTATSAPTHLTLNEASVLNHTTLNETVSLRNISLNNSTPFPVSENLNKSPFWNDTALNATSIWKNNVTSNETSSIHHGTLNVTSFSDNATLHEPSLLEHRNTNVTSSMINATLNGTSMWNNATLNETSYDSTVNETSSHHNATLNKTSLFHNATLNETSVLTLNATSSWDNATVNETMLSTNITLNETLSSHNVTLNETSYSNNITLNGTLSSDNVTLNETFSPNNSTLNQTLVVSNNVTLNETFSSNNVTLNETLSWQNGTLNDTLSSTNITLNETLSRHNVTHNDTSSSKNSTLNETVSSDTVTHNETISLHNLTLNDTLSTNNATLNETWQSQNVTFNETTLLSNGTLNETRSFENATFNTTSYFNNATLNQTSTFVNATLNETLWLSNGTINQTSLLINATVNETLSSRNGTLNETMKSAGFNETKENSTNHEAITHNETLIANDTMLNQTFLGEGDSFSNMSLSNNGSIFVDCDKLQYPLQVARRDDGNILQRLDSTNGDYVTIDRLDYYTRGSIDAAGIAQVDGGYSAFASFDGYLCRFDRFRRSCFNTSLQLPGANAGAVIENMYYYASDLGKWGAKPVYFVAGIESETPIFTADYRVLVSDRLFSKGAVLDMVAVDELIDGVDYIEDDASGRYLVGLGAGFETLVVRINRTSGYPQQYAVINPRAHLIDDGLLFNATGFAAFAFRETNEAAAHRIYFAANDGRGLFELATPIVVPENCWNSGLSSEMHRACNSSNANVTRRGNAAPGGDDGLNCPNAVWFPAASSIVSNETSLSGNNMSNTTVNLTTYLPTSGTPSQSPSNGTPESYTPSYSPTVDRIVNESAVLANQSVPSSLPTTMPFTGSASWLLPSTAPVLNLSNTPSAQPSYSPSSVVPSSKPTTATTPMPTPLPTPIPSRKCGTPSCTPTAATTPMPTPLPTVIPTTMCAIPTCKPTAATTPMPTPIPTAIPSTMRDSPTPIHLVHPTSTPSALPTIPLPPLSPSSGRTVTPSALSSIVPTSMPSPMPTPLPSVMPSAIPFNSTVTSSGTPTGQPSSASIQLASVRVSFALDFNASESYSLNASKEVVGGAFVSAVENCVGFDSVAFVELSSQTRLRTRRKLLVTDTRRQVNIAADVQVFSSLDEREASQVVVASVETAVKSGALGSAIVAEANATGFNFVSNEVLEGAILVNESLALISSSIAVTLNTLDPTPRPSMWPSINATVNLTTLVPTTLPSMHPTRLPSIAPSVMPSSTPSFVPTHQQTKELEISGDGGKSKKNSTSVLGSSIVLFAIGVAIILLLIFIIVIIYWQARKAKQMVHILTQSQRHSLLNQLPRMDDEISPSSKSLKSDTEQQPVFRFKPEETVSPFADNLHQEGDANERHDLLNPETMEDGPEQATPRWSNSMDESQDETIHLADDTSAQERGSVPAELNLQDYEWEQMLNDVDEPQAPEDWNVDAASILLFRLANTGRDHRDGFASREDIMVTLRDRPDLFHMLGLNEIDERGQLASLIQNTKVDVDGRLSRHQFLLALEFAQRQIEAESVDAQAPPRIDSNDALAPQASIPGLPMPPFLREQSIVIPPPPLDEHVIPLPTDDGIDIAALTEAQAPAPATSPLEPTYSQLKWNVQIAPVSPSDA